MASEPNYETIARAYCASHEMAYLCHEHYYHSNGRHNMLHIAVEDGTGRYEIRVDLNKRTAWR
jgi:hypothetical protein